MKKKVLMAIILMTVSLSLIMGQKPSGLRITQTDESGDTGLPEYMFDDLPLTPGGWVDFETIVQSGYENARVVFVSNEGDDNSGQIYGINDITFDSNGMFQPAVSVNAYETLSEANAQMREGYPDIILLERGNEWTEGFCGDGAGEPQSGYSAENRHIIASYGSGPRPALHLDSSQIGFYNYDENYIIVSGIRFYADDWLNSERALDIRGSSQDILLEDLKVDRHAGGIFQGQMGNVLRNMAVRRCIFTEHEAHDGMFYASHADGLLFEECVFYKPYDDSYSDQSRYGRIFYLNPGDGINVDDLKNLELHKNIFYSSERDAVDCRAGGTVANNLFVQADLRIGGIGGSSGSVVSGTIMYNVFTQSTENVGRSSDITLINPVGVDIQNNIWVDPGNAQGETNAITIKPDSENYSYAEQIDISNNLIYGWKVPDQASRSIWFVSTYSSYNTQNVSDISIYNNEIQQINGSTDLISITSIIVPHTTLIGNKYYSTDSMSDWFTPGGDFDSWVEATDETGAETGEITYPDPNRTIDSYYSSIGGTSSTTEFINRTLNQARHYWSPQYTAGAANNYIREGFDREPLD